MGPVSDRGEVGLVCAGWRRGFRARPWGGYRGLGVVVPGAFWVARGHPYVSGARCGTRWLVVRGVLGPALGGVGEVGRGWWPGRVGWREATPTGDGRGLAHGGWWCAGVRVGLGWTSRVGRGWWPGRVGWREATPMGDGRGLAGGREVHAPERSTPRWDGGQRRGRGGRYPPWRRRRGRRPPGTGRPRRSAPALPAARRCPA